MNIRGLIMLWWFNPQSASGSSDIVEAKFTRKGDGTVTNVIASTSSRSKIGCSKDCASIGGCASFTFNETACYMQADDNGDFDKDSDDSKKQEQTTETTTTTTVHRTTAAICAGSSVYEPRTLAVKNYLLRFGDSPVIGDVARMCCEDDGANPITIESQAMLNDVAALITALGHDKAQMWTDGRDVLDNDIMYSRSGSELPFITWADGDPDNGSQDCAIVVHDYVNKEYRFADAGCANNKRVYMCQK